MKISCKSAKMKSISLMVANLCLISVAMANGFENWQDLVDNKLLGSGNFLHAAASSLDGNRRTTSPGFTVGDKEVHKILSTFGKHVLSTPQQRSTLMVAGQPYVVRIIKDKIFYGQGKVGGICAVRTGEILIIGVYDIKKGRLAVDTMESVANSLRKEGY